MTKKKNSKKGGHYMSYVMYHMCTNTHTSHFNTLEQPRTTTTIIHVCIKNQISFTKFLYRDPCTHVSVLVYTCNHKKVTVIVIRDT